MSEKKDTKPTPEPAETLTEEELEAVAGGMAGPLAAKVNIAQTLQVKQREVLSSVGVGIPVEEKILKQ